MCKIMCYNLENILSSIFTLLFMPWNANVLFVKIYGEFVIMHRSLEIASITRLRIHQGAFVNLGPSWKKDRVRSPYTRLFFVTGGEGYLKFGEETMLLEPGYAYLIPPEFTFSYGCTKLSKLYFLVTLSATENYDLLAGIHQICRIPYSLDRTQELIHCYKSQDYYDLIRLKMRILETILECRDQCALPPIFYKQYSDLVSKSMEHIKKNISLKLRAETVADRMHTSVSTLRKAFKEETGEAIGKYIEENVFLRAKQLLTDTEIPINEISSNLGFYDQFYFSRRFKQRFGMSPSQFRKGMSRDT